MQEEGLRRSKRARKQVKSYAEGQAEEHVATKSKTAPKRKKKADEGKSPSPPNRHSFY